MNLLGLSEERVHPPTQDTTGLPVEECESGHRSCFGAMFALFWKGRMNCFEAPTRKRWSEEESITGTTALAVGLHSSKPKHEV